jgi:hypothetical protein
MFNKLFNLVVLGLGALNIVIYASDPHTGLFNLFAGIVVIAVFITTAN